MRSATPGRVRGPGRARLALALALISLLVSSGCGSTGRETPSCAPGSRTEASTATPRGTGSTAAPADRRAVQDLASEVTEAGAMVHLEALQAIADRHGGHRAAPSPGYEASVEYVVGVLRAAGYDVATPTYDGQDDDDDGGGGGCTLRNVIAQTRTGDPESVVVIGAHLDSVEDGPGVVDNGSGVATLLEIASRLGSSAPLQRSVRFAFFGSEEEGAVGSTAYVESLSEDDRRKILLYLNVDMVASSNGGYFVQGGKGNSIEEAGPPGSAAVSDVLARELAKTGVAPETTEFVGDDESPFVEAGIPSAGAENGDAREKDDAQARAWGGQPGVEFDPCYHQACDDLSNVDRVVLDRYLRAIAGTTAYFATSNATLPD